MPRMPIILKSAYTFFIMKARKIAVFHIVFTSSYRIYYSKDELTCLFYQFVIQMMEATFHSPAAVQILPPTSTVQAPLENQTKEIYAGYSKNR